MKTFEEQQAFFESLWPAMKAAAEQGGSRAVVAFIEGFADPKQRRVLYYFARQGLVMEDWEGKTLDACVAVARAGIAAFRAASAAAKSEEARKGLLRGADIISYNLSADLADCWPGDRLARTRAHFEAGRQAAEDCVRWREELSDPPSALARAFWAQGMHQFSLGDASGAARSWEHSLACAVEAEDEFGTLLGEGYLGLAEWARGDAAGRRRYAKACDGFRALRDDERRRDEAQFGLDQLATVAARIRKEGLGNRG